MSSNIAGRPLTRPVARTVLRRAVRPVVRTAVAIGLVGLGAGLAIGLVVGFGLRRRVPIVLDALRHLSRNALNPKQMETAGEPGAYASVIEHIGRVSGTRHRTPIVVRPIDDSFVISLTYGHRADWVKNVMAAGAADLVTEGEVHTDLRPEIVPLDRAEKWISSGERRLLRVFGIDTCLRLQR